ncbi:hypothetical protein Poli38472_004722 [Pythium oligandrum]|uniref:Macro domain-containing protein n=1 Tax=Pythium oligandrum TaxID=41045 RepID=A0A8K1FIE2_PYTOL|nr:hypothetical protein Poli38472_004722 [Pythium oligandrum]|eukprot:TMW59653.1 hypothetical protein Poli38472_004722 [Pythium oligandrum]
MEIQGGYVMGTTMKKTKRPTPVALYGLTHVLHLELVMQKVLVMLPLVDLDAFLTTLHPHKDLKWLQEESELWKELLIMHFGGRRELTSAQASEDGDSDAGEDDESTEEPVMRTVWLPKRGYCLEMHEFVLSLEEYEHFRSHFRIVRDDIGSITEIEGNQIDAIAFPTNPYLHNPHMGVAAVVFRRAGEELDEHVETLEMVLHPGEAHTTPGFGTGVRSLIHCHGPHLHQPDCFEILSQTYTSVLEEAMEENTKVLALTSISTGNFGMPIPDATRVGVRAIQSYYRKHHRWDTTVAVVCYEADVYEAFQDTLQKTLAAFNT